jgi:Protein of unknown function (DUF1761)
MSLSVLGDVNWLAVIVATIVYFAVGGLWYAPPVLGNAWMRAMGWKPAADERTSNAIMYLAPLITCLVSTIAVAALAEASGTDTFGEGIVLGLVVGIGIAAAVSFVTGFFDPKKPQPMVYAAITAGYHVVGLVAAAAIIGAWN